VEYFLQIKINLQEEQILITGKMVLKLKLDEIEKWYFDWYDADQYEDEILKKNITITESD